ncbi:hypothetical protein JOF28_000284 [Leucobacter exalbidus]|uniref:DUF1643 domain-containing protein n=1 Tax=Leucobacter exalbidus TaxID=662960 RepID=A0A940T2G9_9MICO|nr:DUF1643 domain-containing protein [Leucobacter exalbidus]MBP1325052.1 hypothetical protein [Leucobacter exalbidus]
MVMFYPQGHEATLWKPDPAEAGHRFFLGNDAGWSVGNPPLIALCMNPSYASEQVSDKTIDRLIKASIEHQYSGWVMLNLYPERATDPANLSAYDASLSQDNCDAIEEVIAKYQVTEILGAWGGNPKPTIRQAKRDVLARLKSLGVQVFSLDPLTADKNPRHPTPRTGPLPMLGPKVYLPLL